MQTGLWRSMVRAVLCGLLITFSCATQSNVPDIRPSATGHCFDYTNTLSPYLIDEINNREGKQLATNHDVDLVVVILPSLAGMPIEHCAVELVEKWRIGKSTNGSKGVLMLIAKKEQQVKIEIGYGLEQIYTDHYAGQVEREILKELLEQSDWQKGLLSTIENFTAKCEIAASKKDNVKDISGSPTGFLSGGAGAQVSFDFGAALKKPLPKVEEQLRAYFDAQSTPLAAWQRYMEYCAHMIPDKTIALFSNATIEFFKHWPSSSGQMRAEAEIMSGIPMYAVTEGNYAVVLPVYGDDPKRLLGKCPYFLIRENNGWKIDLAVMARSLIMINNTGGWRLTETYHPYMFAFKNLIVEANNIYLYNGQSAYLGIDYKERDQRYDGFRICPQYNGPAHRAGLSYPDGGDFQEDILLSIDGVKITTPYQDWNELMFNYKPGSTVKVKVVRNGKVLEIPVMLTKPPVEKDDLLFNRKRGDPWCGFYVAGSMPYERKACNDWVSYVVEVVPGSPAANAGIMAGDLIYRVWDDVVNPMKAGALKPGVTIKLEIMRDLQHRKYVTLSVGMWSEKSRGL